MPTDRDGVWSVARHKTFTLTSLEFLIQLAFCRTSQFANSVLLNDQLSQNEVCGTLFCTGPSLPVVWVLKLYCDDADSAVKADSSEGGVIDLFLNSSALYKGPDSASGCLTQHLIPLVDSSASDFLPY